MQGLNSKTPFKVTKPYDGTSPKLSDHLTTTGLYVVPAVEVEDGVTSLRSVPRQHQPGNVVLTAAERARAAALRTKSPPPLQHDPGFHHKDLTVWWRDSDRKFYDFFLLGFRVYPKPKFYDGLKDADHA